MSLPPHIVEALHRDARSITARILADGESADRLALGAVTSVTSDPERASHASAWMAAAAVTTALEALDAGATDADGEWVALLRRATVAQRTVLALVDACRYTPTQVAFLTQRDVAQVEALWSACHPAAVVPPEPPPPLPPAALFSMPEAPSPPPAVEPPPPLAAAAVLVDAPRLGSVRRRTVLTAAFVAVAALAFTAGLAVRARPTTAPTTTAATKVVDPAKVSRLGASQGCRTDSGHAVSDAVTSTIVTGGAAREIGFIAGPQANPYTPRTLVIDLPDLEQSVDEHATGPILAHLATSAHLVVARLSAAGGPSEWNVDGADGKPNDFAFIDDVVSQVATSSCVDLDAVVLAGRGAGARMAVAYACSRDHPVAALVLVGQASKPAGCTGPPTVSTLMIQPGNDALRAAWINANACAPGVTEGIDPVVTTYGTCRNGSSLTVATMKDEGPGWPAGAEAIVGRFLAARPG